MDAAGLASIGSTGTPGVRSKLSSAEGGRSIIAPTTAAVSSENGFGVRSLRVRFMMCVVERGTEVVVSSVGCLHGGVSCLELFVLALRHCLYLRMERHRLCTNDITTIVSAWLESV